MDDITPTLTQKVAAETLGTFVLVFFGCGSIVFATQAGTATTISAIGLTFGLAVMVMVYAVGRISGGHFNPAVSVGAGMAGRIAWRDVGIYVLAQLVGAIVAGTALFVLLQGYDGFDSEGNMGQNFFGDQSPDQGIAAWSAFLLEFLLTALFVLVILAVTDARNQHPALAPLAIGLTLAAIHFVAIPATGTSVNPARSIGPALYAGTDAILQLWLFILAPLLGATAAGLGYAALFGRDTEPVPGSGLHFGRPTPAAVPGYGAPDQYQQQWNQQDAEVQQAAQQAQQGQQTEQAWTVEEAAAQGWTWDWNTQQWRHISQQDWAPEQPGQQEWAAQEPRASEEQWPDVESDGRTQIRPPEAP